MRRMRFVVYLDGAFEWRWRLLALNGQIIADGAGGYRRKRDCILAVKRVSKHAYNAELEVVES